MSFNAQEILARLRAQSTNIPESIPAPPPPSIAPVVESPNKSTISAVSNSKPTISTKVIKAPAALTLTPSQREENLTVRIELEKDIRSLQEELAALKHENRQLRSDKEDVERQFIEYKIKSEDSITKLRGKLAAISMGISPVTNHLIVEDRHGGGRLYHNASHGVNIPTIKPHQQSPHVFLKAGAGGAFTPSFSSPVAPPVGFLPTTPTGGIPYSSGENYTQLEGEGFRDPTFSELMRRNTFEKPDFKDSLRRTSDKRIPVQQSAHNSASKLPPKNNYDYSQGNGNNNKILKAHAGPVLTGRHHQQQYLHNSYSSPPAHGGKNSMEAYYSNNGGGGGGVENKGGNSAGGNNYISGGGSGGNMEGNNNANVGGGSSTNPSGSVSTLMPRKVSKSGLEVNIQNVNESVHHVIRTDGDDDDLEVVEIDLRH